MNNLTHQNNPSYLTMNISKSRFTINPLPKFDEIFEPDELSDLLKRNGVSTIELLLQEKSIPLTLEKNLEECMRSEHLSIKSVLIQLKVVLYFESGKDKVISYFIFGQTKSGFYFEISSWIPKNTHRSKMILSKNMNLLFHRFCENNKIDKQEAKKAYLKTKLKNQLLADKQDKKIKSKI